MEVLGHSGGLGDTVHPLLVVFGILMLNSLVVGFLQRRRARRRVIDDALGALRLRHRLNQRDALQREPGRE